MSTLSGNASKGEKAKLSKYYVLDINHLYKSKGNEPEAPQQKNAAPRKYGMQKLGNLPHARRPSNLPSLKSETTSSDSVAVNLVSNNSTRWGNKSGENQTPTTQTTVTNVSVSQSTTTNTTIAGMSQQVQHASLYPMSGMAPAGHMAPSHHGHADIKTWAMMTYGETTNMTAPSFLAHQSPLFQHEFPSLSSNADTGSTTTGSSTTKNSSGTGSGDGQYGPSPSLRPQTEGSWIQGGSCPQNMMGPVSGNSSVTVPVQGLPVHSYPHIGPDGVRNNLVPSGAGVVPGGPYAPSMIPPHMFPPQFRTVMPSFMLRNAYPTGFAPNFQPPIRGLGPQSPMSPYPQGGYGPPERYMPPPLPPTSSASPPKNADSEEPKSQPEKDDDLSQTLDMSTRFSWAESVEIEYSQKLKANDSENDDGKNKNRQTSLEKELEYKDSKGSAKEQPMIQIATRDKPLHIHDSKGSDVSSSWQQSSRQSSTSDFKSHVPPRFQATNNRFAEEDEWQDRRRQKNPEVDYARQRAKQRKEEEERRFIESKEAAAKKLKMLEEKLGVIPPVENKENKDPVMFNEREMNIPLPDWEKDKHKASSKPADENTIDSSRKHTAVNLAPIPVAKDASEFRELTQLVVDRSSLIKQKEKDRDASHSGSYSRHFNADIPPRFQRQQSNAAQNKQNAPPSNTNISQISDNRRTNPLFQSSQYSSKLNSMSNAGNNLRRDRKDSELSQESERTFDDDRRNDRSTLDNNEYNSDKDRFQRTKHDYHERELENEYEKNREPEFRDRERDREYDNRRNSISHQEIEWEYKRNPQDVSREWEHENKRTAPHVESCTRDREYGRSPEARDWEPDGKKNYYDKPDKYSNDKRDRDYESDHDHKFWEKPVNENDLSDKRRDYNSGFRNASDADREKDREKRRQNYEVEDNFDTNKSYAIDKEKDRDTYGRKDYYTNRKDEKWTDNKDQNYESTRSNDYRESLRSNDHRKDPDFDQRDRDMSRWDRGSPSVSGSLHRGESRDSRTRRDSRESLHDDMGFALEDSKSHSSWAEETEMAMISHLRKENPYREERHDRRDKDYYGHQPSRHIPGPITRDRLESSKYEQESKANLTQLVRSTDKRNIKRPDNQVSDPKVIEVKTEIPSKPENTEIKKQEQRESTPRIENIERDRSSDQSVNNEIITISSDSPPSTPVPIIQKSDSKDKLVKEKPKSSEKEENADNVEHSKSAESISKQPNISDEKRNDRRRQLDRPNKKISNNRWPPSYPVNNRSGSGGGGYGGQRLTSSKYRNKWVAPTRNTRHGDEWDKYSEFYYSFDEISIESGKEERGTIKNDKEKPSLRSSKPPQRKSERDDRNREYWGMDDDYYSVPNRKYESNRNLRENSYYEPARRGRGSFRTNTVNIGKRMDGYGPPSTKSPFTSKEPSLDTEKKAPTEKDAPKSSKTESTEKQVAATEPIEKDSKTSSVSSNKQYSYNTQRVPRRSDDYRDRNWKSRPNNSGYRQGSGYKKSSVVDSCANNVTAEPEEAWETASEGTSAEDKEHENRQNKSSNNTSRRQTNRTVKPLRKNPLRSTSRKRSYDSQKSNSYINKRETQKFYSVENRILGNKHESEKDGVDGTRQHVAKKSDQSNENNKAVKSEDVTADKQIKKHGDYHSERTADYQNGQNRKNVKDVRRQKPDTSNRSRKPPAPNKNANYAVQTVAPRFQKEKNTNDQPQSAETKSEKQQVPSAASIIMKEPGPPRPAPPPSKNAWDKPITASFRSQSPKFEADNSTASISVPNDAIICETFSDSKPSSQSTENNSTSNLPLEKDLPKIGERALLDGSTPPMQTIIFENTNFRSVPSDLSKCKFGTSQMKTRFDKNRLDHSEGSSSEIPNFTTHCNSADLQTSHDSMPMDLAFSKGEDGSDMKLNFTFDSTEYGAEDNDKSAEKVLSLSQDIQIVQTATAADLNFKIASVKKVWDVNTLIEYEDGSLSSFVTPVSFGKPPPESDDNVCYAKSNIDTTGHVHVDDVTSLGHKVYSSVSPIQVNSSYGNSCQQTVIKGDPNSSSSNVCKVKPQPQGPGSAIVVNLTSTSGLGMHPTTISPPPYTYVSSAQQPNLSGLAAATAQMNFQAAAQYNNMPPIPSPPAILYNSSQQLPTQAPPAPAGLYHQTYQIESTQMMNNQAARSQYGQYPTAYGLSSGLGQTSAFNQSVFVHQSAPPPPPLTATPPDMYASQLSQYRMQPPPSFGNSQQINTSPNTVLISSTSNSLMSAAVKPPPPTQPIGAIGTKAGGYTNQQTSQVYIPYDATTQIMNQNYMSGNQLVPQRPASNVNVVPPPSIQPASSYYNTGTATGQTGFYQPPSNSTLQSQTAAAYGLTTFNAQSAAPNMQNFNSQLTQQYRAPYMKSANNVGGHSDVGNVKTMLANAHDMLNSVFPPGPGPQLQSSAKPRMQQTGGKSCHNPQGLAQAQHAMQQNAYAYQANQGLSRLPLHHHQQQQHRTNNGISVNNRLPQYPLPIQRPPGTYQQGGNSNLMSTRNNPNTVGTRMQPARNNSHLNNIQQHPNSVVSSTYYTPPSPGYMGSSSTKLEPLPMDTKTEKNTDSNLVDGSNNNKISSVDSTDAKKDENNTSAE